jgi:hypothetical protein
VLLSEYDLVALVSQSVNSSSEGGGGDSRLGIACEEL